MARRSHKHSIWPPDHPRYAEWPDCPYPTKKECDAAMRAWKAEVRDHDRQLKEAQAAAKKAKREVAFLEYQESERQRIAAMLRSE